MTDQQQENTITLINNTCGKKKKCNHQFEIYISKLLKDINPKNGITSNGKQQLNSALCIILRKICSIITELTTFAKKKTISDKEIRNAIKIIFSEQLAKNSITQAENSIIKYRENKCNSNSNNQSRQNKCGIIFPPSIIEKFLRNFGASKFMVTSDAPVFLASVLEFITSHILTNAGVICKKQKRIRITIRDLELMIRSDQDFDLLFKSLNISFLGGGVIPFIHSSLLQKNKKKIIKKKEDSTSKDTAKKAHKFRYGTLAVKNIRKQQKNSDSLVFSKSSFEKVVRSLVSNYNNDVKISKDVFVVLQHFLEQYVVNFLKDANFLAIHCNRVKLIPKDILLVRALKDNSKKNPYESKDIELLDMNGIDGTVDKNNQQQVEIDDEDEILLEEEN
jgi:histone H3/H4